MICAPRADRGAPCGSARSLPPARLSKEAERIEVQPLGDSLDGPECEVALASFEPADVRAVESDEFGESLLAEAQVLPMAPEVPSQDTLKLAIHTGKGQIPLLERLQTYK